MNYIICNLYLISYCFLFIVFFFITKLTVQLNLQQKKKCFYYIAFIFYSQISIIKHSIFLFNPEFKTLLICETLPS